MPPARRARVVLRSLVWGAAALAGGDFACILKNVVHAYELCSRLLVHLRALVAPRCFSGVGDLVTAQ